MFKDFLTNNPHIDVIYLLLHDINLFRVKQRVHDIKTSVQIQRFKKAFIVMYYVLEQENEIEGREDMDLENVNFDNDVNTIDEIALSVCRYFEKKSKKKFLLEKVESKKPIVCIFSLNLHLPKKIYSLKIKDCMFE